MATYYTPAQRRGFTPTYSRSHVTPRGRQPRHTEDLTPSASILIFPSPSNAVEPTVPDSPYASSISSLPTEISFATDDRWGLSHRSTSRCSDRSPSRCSSVVAGRERFTSPSWEDLGDELRHASQPPPSYLTVPLLGAAALYAGTSATAHDQPPQWLTLNPRPRRDSVASYFSDYQEPPQPEEAPREHLPLLSMLRKLFAIDDDTIDVLTRPASQRPDLFDASPYAPGDAPDPAPVSAWTRNRGAGLTDFERPTRGLKRGLAARSTAAEWEDSPFALRASLWTLMTITASAMRSKGKTSDGSARSWRTQKSS